MKIFAGDRYVGTMEELEALDASEGSMFIDEDAKKMYFKVDDTWESLNAPKKLNDLTD